MSASAVSADLCASMFVRDPCPFYVSSVSVQRGYCAAFLLHGNDRVRPRGAWICNLVRVWAVSQPPKQAKRLTARLRLAWPSWARRDSLAVVRFVLFLLRCVNVWERACLESWPSIVACPDRRQLLHSLPRYTRVVHCTNNAFDTQENGRYQTISHLRYWKSTHYQLPQNVTQCYFTHTKPYSASTRQGYAPLQQVMPTPPIR